MSDIKEYKCPACGGTMEFDSTSQKMKCPYCDTEISVEEYEALLQTMGKDAVIRRENKTKPRKKKAALDDTKDG